VKRPSNGLSEFDQFSARYADLLKDPIRDRFASADGLFFHTRKIEVIQEFFQRQRPPASDLSWLDVGCGRGELLRLGGNSFRRAQGCDPSAGMLQECSDLSIEIQTDPCKLPYAKVSISSLPCAFTIMSVSVTAPV